MHPIHSRFFAQPIKNSLVTGAKIERHLKKLGQAVTKIIHADNQLE